MQYVNTQWIGVKDHKMKLWRILPAEVEAAISTATHWSSLQQDKISSTSEHAVLMLNFTHFTLGMLKKHHFALQKHHFAFFFHYFLQLALKLKMGQHFNTIPSKCLYIYTLMPGRFEEYRACSYPFWNHRMAHATINLPLELMWTDLLQKILLWEKRLQKWQSFCLHLSEIHWICSLQK